MSTPVEMYSCDICGRLHHTKEDANACKARGELIEKYQKELKPYIWIKTKFTYDNGNTKYEWLLPYRFSFYSCVPSAYCTGKTWDAFDTKYNQYVKLGGQYIVTEMCDIITGYKKYGLLPIIRQVWPDKIPRSVKTDVLKVHRMYKEKVYKNYMKNWSKDSLVRKIMKSELESPWPNCKSRI